MQSRPSSEYQYVISIQTTGLKPENGHRIIEIACFKLMNGADTGEYVHLYINPEGKLSDPGALQCHSIKDEFLKDKPAFGQIVHEFMQFIQSEAGSPALVIHNAGFANKFLEMEMQKADKLAEWNALLNTATMVDTWAMAMKLHPQHNKLEELAEEYKVTSSDREAGMYKADLLAKLYPHIKERYEQKMALNNGATAANTGLFSLSAKAAAKPAAKPAAKRCARKHVMSHASGM